MSLTVQQTLSQDQTYSGTFPGAVGLGDSIVQSVTAFTTSGSSIASATPTFGGNPVGSASKLAEIQSVGGNAVYAAIWLLPGVGDGSTQTTGIAVSNAGSATVVGLHALDVASTAPLLIDQQPAPQEAATGNPNSGTTGAIRHAPELVVAVNIAFAEALTQAGAPWTELTHPSNFAWTGYQTPSSAGGTYVYNLAASGGSAGVCGAIVTLYAPVASGSGLLIASFP